MKTIKLVVALALFSLGTTGALAQTQTEIEFVTNFFDQLQPKSIAQNREYCGYFGLDRSGNLVASKPTKGDEGSCLSDDPDLDMKITSSYHTHSAFSYDYYSEVPSSDDLLGDIAEEINGYVATPGGRIWFNSVRKRRTVLLCGRNCTVSDPDYDANSVPAINNSYGIDQLITRENQ